MRRTSEEEEYREPGNISTVLRKREKDERGSKEMGKPHIQKGASRQRRQHTRHYIVPFGRGTYADHGSEGGAEGEEEA